MSEIHTLVQGTAAWHEFRLHHHGASEAAAMLGVSPYKTRNELLAEKATGVTPEVDAATQRIFDRGHEVEAMARPIMERILGVDLYPATLSEGSLSASCDGLTMDGTLAWEHKQWNQALADSVSAGVLPPEHVPQCQQVLMVTCADELVFTVSDGTEENMVWMRVAPDLEYQAKIRVGWEQFERDLQTYEAPPVAVPVIAQAQEALPAVFAQVTGSLSVQSNLDVFSQALRAYVERIPKAPETDQEFADTEAACKSLKDVEDRLTAAEDNALASLTSVEQMRRTVADLKNLARQTRLASEKLVKSRKEAIRTEIVVTARQQFQAFVAGLQAEVTRVRLNIATPDFALAIKGLKTLSSIKDAADTAVANAKIEANEYAADIRAKLAKFDELVPAEYAGLFRDLADLVTMAPGYFEAAVSARVEQQKAVEKAKAEAIRLQAEAHARAEAERAAQASVHVQNETPSTGFVKPESAPEKLRDATPVRTADDPAVLALGAINARLAPISLTAAGLAELGIEHSATHKASKLYRESDFPRICAALMRHIESVLQTETA